MSLPTVIHWQPVTGNTAAISSLQDYAGAGNLILNSNLPGRPINGPYVYEGVARTVSFTSANNLSAISVTITGIGSPVDAAGNPTGSLGQTLTETRAGPNSNTVYSANIYTQITSITINGAANGLSVGFGASGIAGYVFMDYNRIGWYSSYQAAIYNRTTLTYTVYVSLTNPDNINYQFGNLSPYPRKIPAFPISAVDETTNQLLPNAANPITSPVVLVWAAVKATAGEDFYFTVVQQGIRS